MNIFNGFAQYARKSKNCVAMFKKGFTTQIIRKSTACVGAIICLGGVTMGLTSYGFLVAEVTKNILFQKKNKDSVPAPHANDPFLGQMVYVAGGTFTMGSPVNEQPDRRDNECQHQVTVPSFFMGKYEVMQSQWKAVMGSNPSHFSNCDECPVENVSWDDVKAFIKKLNGLTEGTYRLPTETEWEYAARGGTKSEGYTCAGSNVADEVAWHYYNSGEKTHVVGGKRPNELGLYDMSGNVWEWCQNTLDPYPCDANPTGSSRLRVLRGGSAGNRSDYCRSAFRLNDWPTYRGRVLGFRLVSAASP